MYREEAIQACNNRIGWSDVMSDLPFTICEANKTATSGKTFDWYHSLVNLRMIYDTVPIQNMLEEDFNKHLNKIKLQAVTHTLVSILDTHPDYNPDEDYTNVILSRPELFDDAIGYTVAIKVIESYISSPRQNSNERAAKTSYQQLKIELEGAKNDQGHIVARGLKDSQKQAILKAQAILFPIVPITDSLQGW